MAVLLDTHIWLWWLDQSENLPQAEIKQLDQLATEGALMVSTASLIEVERLHARGRLNSLKPFHRWLASVTSPEIISVVPITMETVLAQKSLPESFHKDPMDRLIVATAYQLGVPLASHDQLIKKSVPDLIWKSS